MKMFGVGKRGIRKSRWKLSQTV